MKKLLYILTIGLITTSSCTNTDDVFKKDNSSPLIKLKGEYANEYSKNAIDSTKITQQYYELKYKIEDEENKSLQVGTNLRYETIKENHSGTIKFALDAIGEFDINISYRDSWGQKDNIEFKLIVFNNLPPVAKLEVSEISNNEWLIDASTSYDRDKNFQGKIVLYRYFVNKKEIDKTYHSSIKYVFPESDTYEIGVQVKDNDNEWSELVYKTIKIQ